MPLVFAADGTVDLFASLRQIRTVVFDLNSLPNIISDEELDSFKQILRVLIARDFNITLLLENEAYPSEWRNRAEIAVINIPKNEPSLLFRNSVLFSAEIFWVTENSEIQQHLTNQQCLFAYGTLPGEDLSGLHYEHFQDLVELLHPSKQTAILLSDTILQLKNQAPKLPLLVGIGGPEECGHAYFVEALIEELENSDYLIEGIDLTDLLSTEFHMGDYWRSREIQDWTMNELLLPFAEGKRICIESPPEFMRSHETNAYPFFLAPEMILVVWGNTTFLPQIQEITDWSILLELSPKVATARLFGISEEENFDPDFIRKYEENDGRLYQGYLKKFGVENWVEQKVDFNNFQAFRTKS
ncbi:MAG: hypothetical protein HQM13_16855 [SAR324 cluster bacterium]|nr:hypothetical protein [SAR324 cluster bacterium]